MLYLSCAATIAIQALHHMRQVSGKAHRHPHSCPLLSCFTPSFTPLFPLTSPILIPAHLSPPPLPHPYLFLPMSHTLPYLACIVCLMLADVLPIFHQQPLTISLMQVANMTRQENTTTAVTGSTGESAMQQRQESLLPSSCCNMGKLNKTKR